MSVSMNSRVHLCILRLLCGSFSDDRCSEMSFVLSVDAKRKNALHEPFLPFHACRGGLLMGQSSAPRKSTIDTRKLP